MDSDNRRRFAAAVLIGTLLWGTIGTDHAMARLNEDNFIPAKQIELSLSESDTNQEYEIKRGDSLWRIAQIYKINYRDLAAANNLNLGTILKIGQILRIPVEEAPIPPAPSLHLVQPGQTIWRIAQLYRTDIDSIMQTNGMSDPQELWIGQRLVIPGEIKLAQQRVASVSTVRTNWRQMAQMNWPITGVITSRYGARGREIHHGIDIAGKIGDPIKAARSGRVVFAGWKSVYGRTVIVDHGDGICTLYAHASKLTVQKDDLVDAGDVIANIGVSGRTTGPHLHFEVYEGEKTVDPMTWLSR